MCVWRESVCVCGGSVCVCVCGVSVQRGGQLRWRARLVRKAMKRTRLCLSAHASRMRENSQFSLSLSRALAMYSSFCDEKDTTMFIVLSSTNFGFFGAPEWCAKQGKEDDNDGRWRWRSTNGNKLFEKTKNNL